MASDACAVRAAGMFRMIPDLYWVEVPARGRLAIIPRPRGGDWLGDELTGLLSVGVSVLVSLLEASEETELELDREEAKATNLGLHFVRMPIPDRGIPPSFPEAGSLLQRLAEDVLRGESVVVHCRQGLGRSAMIAAGVLVLFGMEPAKAFAAIELVRGLTVPDTDEQEAWVERLTKTNLRRFSGPG